MAQKKVRAAIVSQEKLAEAIGIEATQVSKLKHGYANSKLTTVYALCRVLEVSLGELVERQNRPRMLHC